MLAALAAASAGAYSTTAASAAARLHAAMIQTNRRDEAAFLETSRVAATASMRAAGYCDCSAEACSVDGHYMRYLLGRFQRREQRQQQRLEQQQVQQQMQMQQRLELQQVQQQQQRLEQQQQQAVFELEDAEVRRAAP